MYKALAVAALLLPTFVLAQSGKPAGTSASTFPSPLIVAKGKLRNQTAPIATTTIFTPTQDGLYRLSVYATVTTTDSNSTSTWNFDYGWTDDSGSVLIVDSYFKAGHLSGPFLGHDLYGTGGMVKTLEAKAGTPVTYDVTLSGPPDNSAYSLYYTLERLE